LAERGVAIDVDAIERELGAELDAAVAFAEAGTLEPLEALGRHLTAEATP
jgi:hypothetical protein